MADHVIGIVAKISDKPTANGGTVYNVCIQEEGRDDEWFGHGFDEPAFGEGDEIEFDILYRGDYTNIDPDTVNVISQAEPKQQSRGRSGGGRSNSQSRSSSGGGRGQSRAKPSRGNSRSAKPSARPAAKSAAPSTLSKDEWQKKDNMIRRQACMNTAINLVTLLLTEEAVSLPKKKADHYDAVVALCDEEAERLYDQYDEQVHGGGTSKRGQGREDYDDDIPE